MASARPEGFLSFLGHLEWFLQKKKHCSNDQYEVPRLTKTTILANDYTGSDVTQVNKVRDSIYGPGQQCKIGSGEGSEERPCIFEDWLSECDINEEER